MTIITVEGLGPVEIKGDTPTAEEAAGIRAALDAKTEGNFTQWAGTRIKKGLANVAGAPRAAADANEAALSWAGEKLGMPKTGAVVGHLSRYLMPGMGIGPSGEEITEKFNKTTGLGDANAPRSWGTEGKVLDAAAEGAVGALALPAGGAGLLSNMARNVIPGAIGGGASEYAGEKTKGTPFETPARIVAGLLGGVGGAGAQNAATSSIKGVANIAGSNLRDIPRQAQRILGRAVEADRIAADPNVPPQNFLPGTPWAATQGENVQGAVRGAYNVPGPARGIIGRGERDFRENAGARIEPVLDNISPIREPASVRGPRLMEQAHENAAPLYQASGAIDNPQTILTRRPGAAVPAPSAVLGPDGQPLTTMRPGPPVTTVQGNYPQLQSPQLIQYMGQSADVQAAITQARRLPDFRNMPATAMPMIDKIYKNLGGLEGQANRSGNGVAARDIGNVRRQLGQLIEAENPVYGRALRAYADPASLASAAELGATMAGRNVNPGVVEQAFQRLETDAHRREFLGGFAGELRGKVGGTDRATPAERFWNNGNTRGAVERLFNMPPDVHGPSAYGYINSMLEGERTAARALRDMTKGSSTSRNLADIADNAGGDGAGIVSALVHKGVKGAVLAKVMETIGVLSGRATEGRTRAVNEHMARMAMEQDPAQIVRNQGLVETARQQAQATDSSRRAAMPMGGVNGLLQANQPAPGQPGPADRLMQGLLMGGP